MSDPKGTAVVTGATGGVGALYAAGLAERGYDLLLVGRQRKTLEALAKAVKQKANVKVETLVANLAQAKDLARIEARISSDPAITVHGPTQIATRGRSKSPPEADPNRHPRPMVIAT